MKTKLSNIFSMLVALLIFAGCNTEEEPQPLWPDDSTIKSYISWMSATMGGSIGCTIVDNLDLLFQASAHRDSLRCGGDADAVLRQYFSNPNLMAPKFNEDGEICWWDYGSQCNITHNGISLSENGAEWIVEGTMDQYWEPGQHPNLATCRWKVSRKKGQYTLTGELIHNGLYENFLTMIKIPDVKFTTSIKETTIYFSSGGESSEETKRTVCYCFDGDIEVEVEDTNIYRPDVKMTFIGLTGYNPKLYFNGVPVFDVDPYFRSGKIVATIYDEEKPWRMQVIFTPHGTSFTR